MKREFQRPMKPHPERGAVLVLVAISMVALVGIVALALDVGYLLVTRNEVQNVADGSALAGARTLGAIYQDLTYSEQQGYYCGVDCQGSIRNVAQDVASKNRAGGNSMSVRVEDVLIGHWDGETFTGNNYDQPDAVYVIARRDSTANQPVSTFFARVFGIDEAPVNAEAVAAMTGQGTTAKGELELPIGISRWFWDQHEDPGEVCNEDIKFSPTNDPASCAGWHTWSYDPPNDRRVRRILDEEPDWESPESRVGVSEFEFIGGDLSTNTFDALLSLFQRKGCATDAAGDYLPLPLDDGTEGCVTWEQALDRDDAVALEVDGKHLRWPKSEWDPDGSLRYLHRWDTTVPIYDWGDCSNPNKAILIVGYGAITLTDVLGPPNKQVMGKIVCNVTSQEDNRGGGHSYGLKGPIPGLVR